MPSAFECENWGQEVNEQHIQNAIQNFTETPKYCNPDFFKLVQEIFPDVLTPTNLEEAAILYHKILIEIGNYSDDT